MELMLDEADNLFCQSCRDKLLFMELVKEEMRHPLDSKMEGKIKFKPKNVTPSFNSP